MKLLLDTHIFLWFITGDERLLESWLRILLDPDNTLYLGVVSTWEASIKYHSGKLELPVAPEVFFPQRRLMHEIECLPFEESDLLPMATLPTHHRDPFDRAIICQAISRGLTIVTLDSALRGYPVSILE